MKYKSVVLTSFVAGASVFCAAAYAQSSIILYGIADVSVRYLSNANSANQGSVALGNGAVTNSRWGITGKEDLGNGLRAIFRLENGFNQANGTFSDSQRLFNRGAYVGIESPYGTVTFGRQRNVLFDILADKYDPLTVGNYFENGWLDYALGSGLFADNSIKYKGSFSGFSVETLYSRGVNSTSTGAGGFSGQLPGHLGAGTQYGLTVSYDAGPLSIGVAAQQTSDNSNNKQTVYNANATYTAGSLKGFVGYLYSKDNTGFVDTVLAQQPLTPGTDILKGSGRIDSAPFVGVTYQVSAPLALTGAAYYDHISNAAIGGGAVGSGNRYTLVTLAEYAVSKRTYLYGTVDFNKVSGAAAVELPGKNNQTGVALGMRHVF
jgi:predicted porin